jgi:hypothetical protein
VVGSGRRTLREPAARAQGFAIQGGCRRPALASLFRGSLSSSFTLHLSHLIAHEHLEALVRIDRLREWLLGDNHDELYVSVGVCCHAVPPDPDDCSPILIQMTAHLGTGTGERKANERRISDRTAVANPERPATMGQ